MPRLIHVVAVLFLILSSTVAISFAQSQPGIRGQAAPSWQVDTWFNLAEGTDSIDVADFRGKVVYLFFFQHRCPACHQHGFPTLKAVHERFADADDVVFVAIQTTWRGSSAQAAEFALPTTQKYDLDIPVGHAGADIAEGGPGIMESYSMPGTPWTVIIDKKGVVQFDYWGLDIADAINLVDLLRAEEG